MKNNIWYQKSDNDLSTAILLLKEGGFSDTICYFAHQAVEKRLKGYLMSKDKNPKQIHSLIVLAKEVSKSMPQINEYAEEISALSDYYIPTRYPVDPPVEYLKSDAKDAIEKATTVLNFLKDQD